MNLHHKMIFFLLALALTACAQPTAAPSATPLPTSVIQYFLTGVMLFSALWTTLIWLGFNRQVRDSQRVDRNIAKKAVLKIIFSCVITGVSFGLLFSTLPFESELPFEIIPFREWLSSTILSTLFCTVSWIFLALFLFGLRLFTYLLAYSPKRGKDNALGADTKAKE